MQKIYRSEVIALLVVLGLSGCGSYRKTVADITGYTKVCVNTEMSW